MATTAVRHRVQKRRRNKVTVSPIRTKVEYEEAVAKIHELLDIDPAEGTQQNALLEVLSVLVEAYEDEHVPEPEPATPQQIVRVMAEQRGIGPGDLAEMLGGRSRLSDFMKGKRALSRSQILILRARLGIPADLPIG